ncbi:hypothetical protein [Pseudoalteromonas aurantia]|uniref:Uncharacterized protein n=1 Tax=Pseudoalteromonas aurantia 208 TaxID=1314867 RepID=A0ABR9EAH0_9GAMM|nr:hypothetical protein [Pseudoalteromonas aurantia]MBE0367974.1 hypothetical protein [Pseudoalteromonas aurantia 208]
MRLNLKKKNMKNLSMDKSIDKAQTPEVAGAYRGRQSNKCHQSWECKSDYDGCTTVTCF